MKTLDAQLLEAETKAWDSLSRYKFIMFGYWAGVWVHLNRMQKEPSASPFTDLVKVARRRKRFMSSPSELDKIAAFDWLEKHLQQLEIRFDESDGFIVDDINDNTYRGESLHDALFNAAKGNFTDREPRV